MKPSNSPFACWIFASLDFMFDHLNLNHLGAHWQQPTRPIRNVSFGKHLGGADSTGGLALRDT